MKIATFNINGVNQRIDALIDWLSKSSPDVVCLQELKADDNRFPIKEIRDAGYGAVWLGQKSWNGVAILAKGSDPIETRRGLPNSDGDPQSRYIEAAVNGIVVGCLYLPNGNPQPGPKFEYKLAWLKRFNQYAATLMKSAHPVALCGDFNVVPTDFDIYDTKSWKKNALLQPESRTAFSRLLEQGWTDSLRKQFPEKRIYTFWDYFRNHWKNDRGLRIDHILLSPELAKQSGNAGVDRYVRDAEHASDHAPVWIELTKRKTRLGKVKKTSTAVVKSKAKNRVKRVVGTELNSQRPDNHRSDRLSCREGSVAGSSEGRRPDKARSRPVLRQALSAGKGPAQHQREQFFQRHATSGFCRAGESERRQSAPYVQITSRRSLLLDKIRPDPRYRALLTRMNMD